MITNRRPHINVTMEEFLSQKAIRHGIRDTYNEIRFRYFRDEAYALQYERGRHIGAYAKTKRFKIRHLYDGFLDCEGKPLGKLVSLAYEMRRLNLYV